MHVENAVVVYLSMCVRINRNNQHVYSTDWGGVMKKQTLCTFPKMQRIMNT